jgi:cytoskeletal protein CcmA (bactofilin family)
MKTSNDQNRQTTVEEGTQFKGTLSSTCPVVVRGVLDGDIKAPSLTVAPSGMVTGNVRAQSIRSEGVLAGNVDADDVSLSGSVRSDTVIRAKTLEVKLKADKQKLEVTFGECILEVGDDPGAEALKAPESYAQEPAEASGEGAEESEEPATKNGRSGRVSFPPPAG